MGLTASQARSRGIPAGPACLSSPGQADPGQPASSPGLADPVSSPPRPAWPAGQPAAHREVLDGIRQLHERMSELERALMVGNRAGPEGPQVRARVAAEDLRRAPLARGPGHHRRDLAAGAAARPAGAVLADVAAADARGPGLRADHRAEPAPDRPRIEGAPGTEPDRSHPYQPGQCLVGSESRERADPGHRGNSAGPLLGSGAVIWLTNVIVFGLWYWEFDRGGPVARATPPSSTRTSCSPR